MVHTKFCQNSMYWMMKVEIFFLMKETKQNMMLSNLSNRRISYLNNITIETKQTCLYREETID